MKLLRALALIASAFAASPARADEASPAAPTADLPVVVLQADGGKAAELALADAGTQLVALADAGSTAAPVAVAATDGGALVAPEGVAVVNPAPAAPSEGSLPPLDPTLLGKSCEPDVVAIPEDGADSDDADSEVADDNGEADPESESHDTGPAPLNDHYYTADLSDSELEKVFKTDRKTLGAISVGFTDAGRLINGEHFPCDGPWQLVVPDNAWGTHETNEFLETAFRAVDEEFPGGPPARLNHVSGKEGGYLRPHHSHQSGRDADIGFYYKTMPGARVADRTRYMDLPRNWSLLRNLITKTDVQFILVDKRIQAALIKYALSIGENREWVNSIFHNGAQKSIVMHARHHRDHFHVRFYNARAQELGRRVQPLLAKDKNEHHNIAHRIRRGDSIGRIAQHYGLSIAAIKKANGLRSNMIRAGHVLVIPVRGPCMNCPLPPPVLVPPRRLPPEPAVVSASNP